MESLQHREPIDRAAFAHLAEPYRRELKLHCYRMVGSLGEAEDLVQETFLRAWNGIEGFEGRSSLRGWLYRIATNCCLDALAKRRRSHRLLPQHDLPASDQMPRGQPATDLPWLEPFPDGELEGVPDEAPGPEARYELRESVRLAFVAAIQQVPPRQRAVLLLCDVMGWSAIEAANLLGGTVASVNSVLQRARATLAKRSPDAGRRPEPMADEQQRLLLDRYLEAWERTDLEGFVALLRSDATYSMPPWRQWYSGRDMIERFFRTVWTAYGGFRLVPIRANRQPAFAVYAQMKDETSWRAHSIHLLELAEGAISAITLYARPLGPELFAGFGLPTSLAEAGGRASAVNPLPTCE
jgi:RNA polymerase sigma-70 factor, ECF subfamily